MKSSPESNLRPHLRPPPRGFQLLPLDKRRRLLWAQRQGLSALAMVVWLIHRQTVLLETPANTGDQNAACSPRLRPSFISNRACRFSRRPSRCRRLRDVAFSPVSDVLASADCGWQVHNAAINLWAVPGRRLCSRRVAAGRQSNRVQRRRKASAAGGGLLNNVKYEIALYDTNTLSKTASFRDYRLEGIAVATDGLLASVFDWGFEALHFVLYWRMRSELEPDCEVDSVELSRNRQLLAAYVRGCWNHPRRRGIQHRTK